MTDNIAFFSLTFVFGPMTSTYEPLSSQKYKSATVILVRMVLHAMI